MDSETKDLIKTIAQPKDVATEILDNLKEINQHLKEEKYKKAEYAKVKKVWYFLVSAAVGVASSLIILSFFV